MSINPHPNHMPVFHHIAKNAGTYVLSWMMMLCRKYNIDIGKNKIPGWTSRRIRRSIVLLEDGKQLTCCIHTPTDVANINDAFQRRQRLCLHTFRAITCRHAFNSQQEGCRSQIRNVFAGMPNLAE